MTAPVPPLPVVPVAPAAVAPAVPVPAAPTDHVVVDGETFHYPPGIALTDMTEPERTEYWREKAQKHEKRAKAFTASNALTAEQLAELQTKAQKADALERDLMSDKDRAVAEAKETAQAEARASFLPQLVQARFEAAAAGRIEPERLAAILEPLDMSKFLATDGSVDTAKVTAFVDGVAPATGAATTPTTRTGPSATGLGARGGAAAGASVATGRELYQQKHQKKS